jgi:hypothetical protein
MVLWAPRLQSGTGGFCIVVEGRAVLIDIAQLLVVWN